MSDQQQADDDCISSSGSSRREFILQLSAISASLTLTASAGAVDLANRQLEEEGLLRVNIIINGKRTAIEIDSRTTLLDALRESLQIKTRRVPKCGYCTPGQICSAISSPGALSTPCQLLLLLSLFFFSSVVITKILNLLV